MSSTTTTTKSTSKGAKKSKVIILRLSPNLLSQFPSDVKPASPLAPKVEPSPSVQPSEHNDKSSESNSTPLPSNGNEDGDANSLAPPKADNRRRRGGGTITGRKRAPPSIDPNAPLRERGRPGPKKKPRLADGTIDHQTETKKGPNGGAAPAAAGASHKLGPKANTGAINAGLRALDRSGKPCRKWERPMLKLRSFTGTVWTVPTWKAPMRQSSFSGDVKSDSNSSSDLVNNRSSALASEMDVDGGDTTMMNGMDSSPAPPLAA